MLFFDSFTPDEIDALGEKKETPNKSSFSCERNDLMQCVNTAYYCVITRNRDRVSKESSR